MRPDLPNNLKSLPFIFFISKLSNKIMFLYLIRKFSLMIIVKLLLCYCVFSGFVFTIQWLCVYSVIVYSVVV